MRIIVFLACLALALALPRRNKLKPSRSLIVGGVESPAGSRPYQVALFGSSTGGYYSQFCGGTLVHPQWVVTAAHCAGGSVWAGLGYHQLDDKGKQIIKGSWVVNSDYDGNSIDYDVALIKLDTSASLSNNSVQAISIASSGSDVAEGANLLVSGWGSIASGGSYPMELRQAVVTGVSRSQCRTSYPPADITDNMICAGAPGKDSCQGDSGGPIVSNYNENSHQSGVTLEGIVSWGYGCADPNYPGVYTRVANFCSWIASKTSDAVTC